MNYDIEGDGGVKLCMIHIQKTNMIPFNLCFNFDTFVQGFCRRYNSREKLCDKLTSKMAGKKIATNTYLVRCLEQEKFQNDRVLIIIS